MKNKTTEYWNGYRDEMENEIILNTAQEMEDTLEEFIDNWNGEQEEGLDPVSERDKWRIFRELVNMKMENPSQPVVVTEGIINAMICQIC